MVVADGCRPSPDSGDEKSRKKATDAEQPRFIQRAKRPPTRREAGDQSRAQIQLRLLRRLRLADAYMLSGSVTDFSSARDFGSSRSDVTLVAVPS